MNICLSTITVSYMPVAGVPHAVPRTLGFLPIKGGADDSDERLFSHQLFEGKRDALNAFHTMQI